MNQFLTERADRLYKIRLRIDERNQTVREHWLEKLQASGCAVISIGKFGILTEMSRKAIKDLLNMQIVERDGELSLLPVAAVDSSSTSPSQTYSKTQTAQNNKKDPPDSYTPNKRTLF